MSRKVFVPVIAVFIMLFFASGSFAELSIVNGDFDLGTSYVFEPFEKNCSDSNYYTPFTLPTDWDFSCNWKHRQLLCDTTSYTGWLECFYQTTEAKSGNAYVAYWIPNGWSEGIFPTNPEGYTTLFQEVDWEADSIYTLEGWYKTKARNDTTWETSSEFMNESFADFELQTEAYSIQFNLTPTNLDGSSGWKHFEILYDSGACSVLDGDINITSCSYSDVSNIGIYSYWDFNTTRNIYNLTELNEAKMMVDELEIHELQPLYSGVGDYYEQYIQSLDGINWTTHGEIYTIPSTSCMSFKSGKIDTNMKTRWLNITFSGCGNSLTNCDLSSTNYAGTGIINISYWDGDSWKTDTTYNGFETTCNGYTTYQSSGIGYYCGYKTYPYPDNDFDVLKDYSIGLILPINATMIKFMTTHKCQRVGYPERFGYVWYYINISDSVQYSDTPIDTSNAMQSNPTFFPVLTQYIEQEGNILTSYHLNLLNWKNVSSAFKIYWDNLEINSNSTGSFWNNSYYQYSYDSSLWAIDTGDSIWYNESTTDEYFGETYTMSSLYSFNSFDGGISTCQSECVGADYYERTPSGDYCEIDIEECSPMCVPSFLGYNESHGTNYININVSEGFGEYYWSIHKLLPSYTLVANGTTTSNEIEITGLTAGTQYRAYVKGYDYYDCSDDAYISFDFETYSTSEAPSGWEDIIEDTGGALGDVVSVITGVFYKAFGFNESLGKAILWMALAIGLAFALSRKFDERSQAPAMLGIIVIMFLLGTILGWLPAIVGIILTLLSAGIFVMAIKNLAT